MLTFQGGAFAMRRYKSKISVFKVMQYKIRISTLFAVLFWKNPLKLNSVIISMEIIRKLT